ncbi:MAG: hypothetical protein D6706_14090 [Chloroflexi bacterium]|nr:MAG: hypothetical protein D6706_14090 [Chloroflexota bacterium]
MNNDKATRIRLISTGALLALGAVLIVLSLAADRLGLDITPGFGVIQMVLFLIGISCLTLAGFLYLQSLKRPDAPRSLQADIGVRLSATGLVFAYVAGLSDLIGIGTHVQPNFERPFVGPLQIGGIALGCIMIVLGMLLYHTSRRVQRSSSLEFLLRQQQEPGNHAH